MTAETGDPVRVLRERFGYETFRPGQERAVRAVLAGRDTLVVLPTGGGKSLCFQVPALLLPGLTVVMSPLISLMKDQVDALTARGLPATFINGTVSSREIQERIQRAERGEIRMLYLAPERFDYGRTAERLRAIGVSLLAVDEAHCISEWGHDFRPSYRRVGHIRQQLGEPTTIALTATATPVVRADIARQLGLRDPEEIVTGFDRANLRFHVVGTKTDADKDGSLLQLLRDSHGPAVVYAATRKAVERLTPLLEAAGIAAVGYHAGLDDERRHAVQDAFMAERVRVVVATNAFGMGIDKANVRLVVHHAMPGSLEAYYQEAGRAGRDELASDCVLLHAFQDRFTHEFFIKSALPERAVVEGAYEVIRRGGRGSQTAEAIARRLPGKVSAKEVDGAVRLLAREGAVLEPGVDHRVTVRLLAQPERVSRELNVSYDQLPLAVLRAIWRTVGARVYEGAVVDLAALPPELGGAPALLGVLTALHGRGIVALQTSQAGLRPARSAARLDEFGIDWPALARRRQAEFDKLDTVQRYAYASGCRRAFVLRHFGDPAARSVGQCGGCDNCLGARRPAPRSPTSEGATGDGGRSARRPRTGTDRPPRRRGPTSSAAVGDEAIVVGPGDEGLFGALRALRSEIARADRVPSYVVFPDRTLAELAVRRPRSLAALAEVRGVGPAKLDKYGERFLTVIRATDATGAGGDTEAA
jgi:ATP-dependent DNA helicase RecQ